MKRISWFVLAVLLAAPAIVFYWPFIFAALIAFYFLITALFTIVFGAIVLLFIVFVLFTVIAKENEDTERK